MPKIVFNVLDTVEFCERIKPLEHLGCSVSIIDEKELDEQGMKALLAVGQGSKSPTKMAIIEWNGGQPDEAPLALVGKGIVFDSGGISLKNPNGMEAMKGDMAGAAAVAGTMMAIAANKIQHNVVALIPLAENMPGPSAIRPGDIIYSLSGQSIEIVNTDAEGRLILADAIHFSRMKYGPSHIVDIATLTGSIRIALGDLYAGLFSNNSALAEQLLAAGYNTGELLWQLPLAPGYDKQIGSKFADMKNSGGKYGGAITAAQFISRFAGDTPWAHLDIAGTYKGNGQSKLCNSWATGFGVQLLYDFINRNNPRPGLVD